MNTYRQYKRVNSKLVLNIECYCPKCKVWVKLKINLLNLFFELLGISYSS